jgi:hypothetical protein
VPKARKGKKLTRTGHYEISAIEGRKRSFRGILLKTFNLGRLRLAIFSIPKPRKKLR